MLDQDPTELVVYALRTALSALEPIDDVSRLTATAGWQQALLRIAHRVDLDPVADPLSNAQDLNPTPKLLECVCCWLDLCPYLNLDLNYSYSSPSLCRLEG